MTQNIKDKFEYIGVFIRNYRQANGLSLENLANLSGVSRSMISQIESSSTSPTLMVLQKLASAMEIDLRDLVQPPDQGESISVAVANESNLISKADSPFVCHLMRKYQKQTCTEIYHFYFRFSGKTAFGANIKGSTKSIWLESGTLMLHLSSKKILIKEKELISFAASTPHRFESELKSGLAKGTFFVVY
ncbi:helix-turn-helix transcriptional regulator [uncultured Paraglaciecola sp.]|uniref:helix-turn-helix domain-containing protein n=1 Tax=uncultured Paraglaciecola sp. TaxID=1765024 RepID=UPI0030D792F5|tara:strand:- start:6952 stop:7521 length:570 start_codon:yes stop_codon:yes gene_type:complete